MLVTLELTDQDAVARQVTEGFALRREARNEVLCVAEVSAFPRSSMGEGTRTGFALDQSASGLCIQLGDSVPLGVLLRVVLRDFEGRVTRESIGRVAWCRATELGRFSIGVEIAESEVNSEDQLLVHHAPHREDVAVEEMHAENG